MSWSETPPCRPMPASSRAAAAPCGARSNPGVLACRLARGLRCWPAPSAASAPPSVLVSDFPIPYVAFLLPFHCRNYFIAADEVDWQYVPQGRDLCSPGAPKDLPPQFASLVGEKFRKALYREYTDATFTQRRQPRCPGWAGRQLRRPVSWSRMRADAGAAACGFGCLQRARRACSVLLHAPVLRFHCCSLHTAQRLHLLGAMGASTSDTLHSECCVLLPPARSGDDYILGIMGPLLRAEVGDTIRVTFKNNLREHAGECCLSLHVLVALLRQHSGVALQGALLACMPCRLCPAAAARGCSIARRPARMHPLPPVAPCRVPAVHGAGQPGGPAALPAGSELPTLPLHLPGAVTMHPHGVAYLKDSEGSPYEDGTTGEGLAFHCHPCQLTLCCACTWEQARMRLPLAARRGRQGALQAPAARQVPPLYSRDSQLLCPHEGNAPAPNCQVPTRQMIMCSQAAPTCTHGT